MAAIRYLPFSNNAPALTNSVGQFEMLATYVAMHCDSRNLALGWQPSLPGHSGAKQPSKSTTKHMGKN